MIISGVNFGVGIILARTLGLDGYGVFTLLWMVFLFSASLQQALIISLMFSLGPKEIAKDDDKYFSAIFSYQTLFSLAIGLGCLVFFSLAAIYKEEWDLGSITWLISVTIPIYLFHDFFRRVNFLQKRFILALTLDAIAYLGQFGLIGFFAWKGELTIDKIFWSILASFSISTLIGLVSYRHHFYNIYVTQVIQSHFKFSKWLLYSALLQWFTGNYYVVFGSTIMGTWIVGAIKSIQNIMGVLHVFFLGLENFVPARAAEILHGNGNASLINYLKKIFLGGIGVITLLAVIIYFVNVPLVDWIYGSEYAEYAFLLNWFMFIYVLNYSLLIYRYFLRTKEYTFPIFAGYVIGTAFSLITAKYFINTFDYMGIVYGLIAIQTITLGYYFLQNSGQLAFIRAMVRRRKSTKN